MEYNNMNKIIMTVVMAVFFLLLNVGTGNTNEIITLEAEQVKCLQMVYDISSGLKIYGDTWGETIASIAYQESWCNGSHWRTHGVVVGDINSKGIPRSLGIMQVQVPTARWVNKKFPDIFRNRYGERRPSNEEIAIDLLIDNKFNIEIGSHYFITMLSYREGNWEKAILSYNRGMGSNPTDVNNYVHKVKKWRKLIVIPFLRGEYKIKERLIE